MRGSLRYTVLLLAGPLLAGCHKYTPINSTAVPVGAEVRAHLTERGLQQLEFVPRRDPWQVDGSLMRIDERDLVLSIPLPSDGRSPGRRQINQLVTLTREDFVGLDLKETDHTRSALTIGAVGAAFAVVAIMIVTGDFDNDEQVPEDLPESRVPLWLLRF
jgi:hypothetical protein